MTSESQGLSQTVRFMDKTEGGRRTTLWLKLADRLPMALMKTDYEVSVKPLSCARANGLNHHKSGFIRGSTQEMLAGV